MDNWPQLKIRISPLHPGVMKYNISKSEFHPPGRPLHLHSIDKYIIPCFVSLFLKLFSKKLSTSPISRLSGPSRFDNFLKKLSNL